MAGGERLADKLAQLISDLRALRKKILESASVDLMLATLKGVLTNFQPKFSPWRFEPHLDRTRVMPVTPNVDMGVDYVHRKLSHYLGTETLAVLKEFPTISRPDVEAIKTQLQTYTQQAQRVYISRHRNLTANMCVDATCYPIELVYYGGFEFTEEFAPEHIMYILEDANYPATYPLRVKVRGERYDYDDGTHKIMMVLCDELSYYSSSADVWVKGEGVYVKTECREDFSFSYGRSLFFCRTGYTWVFVYTPEWSMEARIPE